jgi:hypothetical protein
MIASNLAQMRKRQAVGSLIAGLSGAYYMAKVLLVILMTAHRKPLRVVK